MSVWKHLSVKKLVHTTTSQLIRSSNEFLLLCVSEQILMNFSVLKASQFQSVIEIWIFYFNVANRKSYSLNLLLDGQLRLSLKFCSLLECIQKCGRVISVVFYSRDLYKNRNVYIQKQGIFFTFFKNFENKMNLTVGQTHYFQVCMQRTSVQNFSDRY